MQIRTILVPTDFSSHSRVALERASELARDFSARIVLLHSYWMSASLGPVDLWTIPPDFMEKVRESANAELEQWAKRASEGGVRVEPRLVSDPTVSAILELAAALPADLIAMGTHGHTGVKHALLGSTAERVVRLAPCPVLTVKAPQS